MHRSVRSQKKLCFKSVQRHGNAEIHFLGVLCIDTVNASTFPPKLVFEYTIRWRFSSSFGISNSNARIIKHYIRNAWPKCRFKSPFRVNFWEKSLTYIACGQCLSELIFFQVQSDGKRTKFPASSLSSL
jgi:hypothetical protein